MSNDFEGIFVMDPNDTGVQTDVAHEFYVEEEEEEEEENCTLRRRTPDEDDILQQMAKEVEERRATNDFQLYMNQIINGTSRSFDDSEYLVALQRTQQSLSYADEDN